MGQLHGSRGSGSRGSRIAGSTDAQAPAGIRNGVLEGALRPRTDPGLTGLGACAEVRGAAPRPQPRRPQPWDSSIRDASAPQALNAASDRVIEDLRGDDAVSRVVAAANIIEHFGRLEPNSAPGNAVQEGWWSAVLPAGRSPSLLRGHRPSQVDGPGPRADGGARSALPRCPRCRAPRDRHVVLAPSRPQQRG